MIRTRYRRIVFFFARILLSFAFWDLALPKLGLRAWSQRTRPTRFRNSAASFRNLAVEMGGVLIKVGQFLSSRVDVLPVEFTAELAGLQDAVPAVPFEGIRQVAEEEFGRPLSEKFARFEAEPLAAASLGQVHRAWIEPSQPAVHSSGEAAEDRLYPVVVKIQRPQIEQIIATDLAALRTVGDWLHRYRPIRRRINVPSLLVEFSRILYEEIDYLAEGKKAETFAANFATRKEIRVPHVVWTHTTRRALTLEDVGSIKITDYEAITAAGVNRSEVASRLLDTYLQQIFVDGFFHADPHPGNLFVQPGPTPEDWQLTFVDFGMVGRVPPRLMEGLREMLIGVGTQDPGRVVRSYQTLGILLPEADLELLEKAETQMFDRFWGKTMNELREISPQEVRHIASEFRELLFAMPFQVPQDLIFLGRTVGILSGMCTGLDPDFNLWDHLVPYAQRLVAEEARSAGDTIWNEAQTLVRSLVSVPRKMDQILTRLERGEVAVQAPEVNRRVSQLDRSLRQVSVAIIFTALLLSGTQMYLAEQHPLGEILLGLSGVAFIWFIFAGRNRRS